MVARLRTKSGGADIPVAIGDFATTTVDRAFSLAYLVFNTIMNLTTQDAQVACFENVGAQLEPGGRFVIEVVVPDLQRLPHGEAIRPFAVTPGRLVMARLGGMRLRERWSGRRREPFTKESASHVSVWEKPS